MKLHKNSHNGKYGLLDADRNVITPPIYDFIFPFVGDYAVVSIGAHLNGNNGVIDSTGKEIIEISLEQLENFAGNMLLLKNNNNKKFIVMSQKAFNSLSPNQIEHLEELAEILHPELGVIETLGGGSARCMIAEIHLPPI